MSRRDVLRILGGAAALGGAVLGCTKKNGSSQKILDQGKPQVQWRMAVQWPENTELYKSALRMAAEIKALTNHELNLEVVKAGVEENLAKAVQAGKYDCAHTQASGLISENKGFAFAQAIPFGLTASQQNAWIFEGLGLELTRAMYSDYNLVNFPCGNTGCQMGGWFKREVKSLSEFKAVKTAATGMSKIVLEAMGVPVVDVQDGALMMAQLKRGEISSASWFGPFEEEQLGFHQEARFYYHPAWSTPGSMVELLIKKSTYDLISSFQKTVIKVVTEALTLDLFGRYSARNQQAIDRFLQAGVVFARMPDEVLSELKKTSDNQIAEISSKNKTFEKIHKDWLSFHHQINQWYHLNKTLFAKFNSINA